MIDSASVPIPTALAPVAASPDQRTGAFVSRVSRILVVDDEDAVRHALTRLLGARGYEVHACASGPAALTLLEQEPFDVMLCDDRMPELSGVELVQHALALDGDLAVLMLSGVNDARTAHLARSAD